MVKPRKYQIDGIEKTMKAIKENGFYALNYDMGTGKTLTTLWIAGRLYFEKNITCLVVLCPKTLISTWEKEIETNFHVENKKVLIWENKKSKKYGQRLSDFLSSVNTLKIFIVNIESFQSDKKTFSKKLLHKFYTTLLEKEKCFLALDESSKIKNSKANRTKNIISCSKNAVGKVILTGTIISETILDFYAQFEFLNPGFWGMKNFWTFKKRYAVLESMYASGGRTFQKVVGFKKIDELMGKIKPHIDILKKEDCLDLPDKVFIDQFFIMPKEMKDFYTQLKNNLMAMHKENIIAVKNKAVLFSKFRQICGGFVPDAEKENKTAFSKNPKYEFIRDELEDFGGKAVIFCCFVNEIKFLEKELSRIYGRDFLVTYYGDVKPEQRKANLIKFQEDKNCRLFIGNPQTAGYGLNLQNANLCYFYTSPLSGSDYRQSVDRLHRIGQKNKVTYKILQYTNSIDESIKKLIENKTELMDNFKNMNLENAFNFIKG